MKTISILPSLIALSLALAACDKDAGLLSQATQQASVSETDDDTTAFRWVRSKDLSTRNSFIKTFGVGYSYNAVRGEYCNWKDIRCQVVSRSELRKYEKDNSYKLFHSYQMEQVSSTFNFYYSLRDYVANVTIDSKKEINLGLYNGKFRKTQYVIENGVQQKIYYVRNDYRELGNQHLEEDNIITAIDDGDLELLTTSFINAVYHIADTEQENFAVVDSFINVYGTHVITNASLGGTLKIDIHNDVWRFSDDASEEEWSQQDFLFAYSDREEKRKNSALFKFLDNSRVEISAVGGDQSTLSNILGATKYDGSRDINLDAIDHWTQSLVYDPDNEAASNVELINMQVTPIWRFIEPLDEEVAIRVKAAILQDAAILQSLLGDRTFFSTSFSVNYPQISCQYRHSTGEWKTYTETSPSVVNIVANGKYVATVCHETIDSLDLAIAYPIYEGVINLACGLGVDTSGTAYRARWINGNIHLLELAPEDVPQTSVFYVNAGEITLTKRDDIIYSPSTAYPYIELSGGVLPDGGYSSTPYPVTKSGKDFLCDAPSSLEKPIVGWTYDNGSSSWKRDSTYVYIFNPNELK